MKGKTMNEQQDIQTFGIPLETTIEGPNGELITFRATPKVDDFATVKDDPKAPPKYESPCPTCHEPHAREGFPLCVCNKCGKYGRIVWCGQCTDCYLEVLMGKGIEEELALSVIDAMSPGYKAYKQRARHDLAKVNKMPWES